MVIQYILENIVRYSCHYIDFIYIYIKYCHWTIHSLVSLLTEYIPLNLGTQDTTHTARSDSLLDISHKKLIELFETSIFLMWTFHLYLATLQHTCIWSMYLPFDTHVYSSATVFYRNLSNRWLLHLRRLQN
jgi:hypothetical protein